MSLIGKIYEIYIDGFEHSYIGSTVTSLEQRLSVHKSAFKRFNEGKGTFCSAFDLLSIEDDENPVKIRCLGEILVEKRNDEKLREFEQKFIDDNPNCVNRVKAFMSEEEYKEMYRQSAKKYYYANIDVAKKRNLDNYYKNIEARRAYYQANKEKYKGKYKYAPRQKNVTKEQSKAYNEAYKEKHKERLTAVTDCACGKKVKGISMKAHLQSKYHCSRVKTSSMLSSNETQTSLCEEINEPQEETDSNVSC